eukprot:88740_1
MIKHTINGNQNQHRNPIARCIDVGRIACVPGQIQLIIPGTPDLYSLDHTKYHEKQRSQSLSISCTYSRNRSKAHSRVIPPTHDSPSLTHCSKSAEITPPPPLHLAAPKQRIRSSSLSHSKSYKTPINDDDETETIEINNGKSLLFSSWFSQNGTKVEEEEEMTVIHLNESDIESAIQCTNDAESSSISDVSVIEESKSNTTFTLGLKPPRKYNTTDKEEAEELISFRDFLAQETRCALRREVVNECNKPKGVVVKRSRLRISKGNTKKIDYGLPGGPYTLYKFVIGLSSLSSNWHWSIRKRYSDLERFRDVLAHQLKAHMCIEYGDAAGCVTLLTLNVYLNNYVDTGDVLFSTQSYIAASLHSVGLIWFLAPLYGIYNH